MRGANKIRQATVRASPRRLLGPSPSMQPPPSPTKSLRMPGWMRGISGGSSDSSTDALCIRDIDEEDVDALWQVILDPVFRAGDALCVSPDIPRKDGIDYWIGGPRRVCVVQTVSDAGKKAENPLGTYAIGPAHGGNGAHVCTAEFITAPTMRSRGVARAMVRHAIQSAAVIGYRAIQLHVWNPQPSGKCIWREAGFVEVGVLPQAFDHPSHGLVDALILHRPITPDDLRMWFHDSRSKADSPALTREPAASLADAAAQAAEDLDATIEPASQMTDEFRRELERQARQPAPPPPPKPVKLDEFGYPVDSWDPALVCMRVAYSLDIMLHEKPSGEAKLSA